MHFDPREQAALREVGLDTDDLRAASDLVSDAVESDAESIEQFFGDGGTFYSDMEMAHSASDVQEHTVDHVDTYTHGAELRGYLKFDSWGVPIEGGRILSEDVVELTLGPTVEGRVKFAHDPDDL
ncbi:hypothetical protein E6P09_04950 [Haloferax mediterranei ATCC 33500]|uniref:Uncharacterized protein n=1 Tax=Haloferax mediterranei (strain ATCC 33500 / DSM 1411 / JCM 8866 / NBRC 14739 / NCIMB 2177 / R-4) TaxID=523841 RepID=I3R1K1_HALMT|nr:hypothetical protein [Haloferax mediterranei]AFK18111.1 hypothetical protein HFX_0375 [Haloferax mediterranei ATCC 33500]AHZ22481.1 hypothetical protein BM92_07385 [Haloferax mediterranei ATCC 33500]EMA02616.1 hypothetical protein C439_08535 [Haloferax mediterranei ATCC 33500]MDX5988201.1 hypothetical protein [Haloferax mediterranei ATCC 33500]QCQ74644.1 hypothetical protein E6P09_04950 [Haloferax mediterranei ATCC 33500]